MRSSGGVTASVGGTGVDSTVTADAPGEPTGDVAAERDRQGAKHELFLTSKLSEQIRF